NYQIKINNLQKPVKFVYVSDLHIGGGYTGTRAGRLNRIIEKINAVNCELVIFGGDFVTRYPDLEKLNLLRNIKAHNKIAVYGNHDADYLDENVEYNMPEKMLE